ncbi:MAG: T9SS type A sorting domain-containing protein [Ignavibacteriae bacterium]|nr:T9SS type A sorting domain-containing protein [Ignavibacteriota bacterium]
MYIKTKNPLVRDKIEIYNFLGTKQLETEFKQEIDVSGLRAGVYFLRIGNEYLKFMKL